VKPVEGRDAGDDEIEADLLAVIVQQFQMNLIVISVGKDRVVKIAVVRIGDGRGCEAIRRCAAEVGRLDRRRRAAEKILDDLLGVLEPFDEPEFGPVG
jgi:hypothetical protein